MAGTQFVDPNTIPNLQATTDTVNPSTLLPSPVQPGPTTEKSKWKYATCRMMSQRLDIVITALKESQFTPTEFFVNRVVQSSHFSATFCHFGSKQHKSELEK